MNLVKQSVVKVLINKLKEDLLKKKLKERCIYSKRFVKSKKININNIILYILMKIFIF